LISQKKIIQDNEHGIICYVCRGHSSTPTSN
jgi:hypothetical protein